MEPLYGFSSCGPHPRCRSLPYRCEDPPGVPRHSVQPAGPRAGEPARPTAAGRGRALGGTDPEQSTGAATDGAPRATAQAATDLTSGTCTCMCIHVCTGIHEALDSNIVVL